MANQVRDELRADPELGAESAIVVYRQEQPIVSDPSGLTRSSTSSGAPPGTSLGAGPSPAASRGGDDLPDGTTAMVPVHLTGDEDADLPESAAA